jgi:hypothetical protein
MIARVWRGVAQGRSNTKAYLRHLTANVLPALKAIDGHREARALLAEYDDFVRHYEVER